MAGSDSVEEVVRCKTYVRGLDERMQGGIPEGYVILVCGHAGTMKSSLTFSILYNQALNDGKRGIYITLEQSRTHIIKHMSQLGLTADEDGIVIKDMEDLVVMDIAKLRKAAGDKPKTKYEEKFDWIGSLLSTIEAYHKQYGLDTVVIDSLAALYALHKFKNPRANLFHFFERLRDLGLTIYLISEIPAGEEFFGIYGVEDFLSDGILHLELERQGRNVNLFLGIVKMRMTKHDRGYYPLIFEDGTFEIVRE